MTAQPGTISLRSLVSPKEIVTSSDLLARLEDRGLNRVNARQYLSRKFEKSGLWRSEHFRMPRDERLYAHKEFVGTSDFCSAVAKVVAGLGRPGISRCLEVLFKRDVLNVVHAQKLLSAALPRQASYSGAPTFDRELPALEELGIVNIFRDTAFDCIVSAKLAEATTTPEKASYARGQLGVECLLSRLIVSHFRKQNVLTWNQFELPSFEKGYTVFNGQMFTAYGYSYLSPVVRWNGTNTKACPVLIDVIARRATVPEVVSFHDRIERTYYMGSGRNNPPLGIIVAREFDKEAWNMARQLRLLTVNLRHLYGEEALEAMVKVEVMLRKLGQDDTSSLFPDTEMESDFAGDLADAIESLKSNPIVTQIRSLAFESLCGSIMHANGYHGVTLGELVDYEYDSDGNTTKRDVDIYGMRGNDMLVVEAKAYHKDKELLPGDVAKFYKETVPSFCKKHDKSYPYQCHAQIWTTGKVGLDAQQALSSIRLRSNIRPALLDNDTIRSQLPYSIKAQSQKLITVLSMNDNGTDDFQ